MVFPWFFHGFSPLFGPVPSAVPHVMGSKGPIGHGGGTVQGHGAGARGEGHGPVHRGVATEGDPGAMRIIYSVSVYIYICMYIIITIYIYIYTVYVYIDWRNLWYGETNLW